MKRCAVFSCMGLGDGLITLVLSHNLALNGYAVDTFHPFLTELQPWFPDLPLLPFPSHPHSLSSYDQFFIVYEKSDRMQAILSYCTEHHPTQTTVLNPIATRRTDYPYWEGGQFSGDLPFVDNLFRFCTNRLQLKVVTKANGITPLPGVVVRRHRERVILHAESSREGKNWPRDKYLQLSAQLKAQGLHPVFALNREECARWDLPGEDISTTQTLSDLALLVAESGYMIGNDSGVGHLASCLGVPTLTICRSAHTVRFWRPAWAPGCVVTPSPWVPNIKGMRWRDKHWKRWVSVSKVLRAFSQSLAP